MKIADQWNLKAEYLSQLPYRLQVNTYGRWVIVNKRDPDLAWSGSCWTEHEDGVATGRASICTFALEEDARKYANGIWGLR